MSINIIHNCTIHKTLDSMHQIYSMQRMQYTVFSVHAVLSAQAVFSVHAVFSGSSNPFGDLVSAVSQLTPLNIDH